MIENLVVNFRLLFALSDRGIERTFFNVQKRGDSPIENDETASVAIVADICQRVGVPFLIRQTNQDRAMENQLIIESTDPRMGRIKGKVEGFLQNRYSKH